MTPLLLLPGMMCDERLYTHQIKTFGSSRQIECQSITQYETVQALATGILKNAPRQFALCGLSMGGIVAMEIIRQEPERVERLALLDTTPLADAPANRTIRLEQIKKVKQGKLHAVMRDELKPNYLAESLNEPHVLDLCMDMALDLGPDVFYRQTQALMSRSDQSKTLQKVCVPTLIMHGESDVLCDANKHQLMHDLVKGSTLVSIKNAGHLPVLEAPDMSSIVLQQWLDS